MNRLALWGGTGGFSTLLFVQYPRRLGGPTSYNPLSRALRRLESLVISSPLRLGNTYTHVVWENKTKQNKTKQNIKILPYLYSTSLGKRYNLSSRALRTAYTHVVWETASCCFVLHFTIRQTTNPVSDVQNGLSHMLHRLLTSHLTSLLSTLPIACGQES